MDSITLPFELKRLTDEGHIAGLISAFGQIDNYGDTVERGAYAKSIASFEAHGRKLPMLYQHDPARPIGVWTSLKEAPDGLYGEAKLTMATRDAQEAYALAKDGALTGISIGYRVPVGGSRREGVRRFLSQIDLKEASLVTFPADNHGRISSVKSITDAGDIRRLLQAAGLSGRQAKAGAGAAWKAINEQTDGEAADAALAEIFRKSAARIAAL